MAAEKVLERQYEAVLLDMKAVAASLSIGQRTLWRWIAAETFPPPDISVGGKIRRWKRETVEAWIAEHAEGSRR